MEIIVKTIALLFFLAVFAAVIVKVIVARRADTDRAARLPLEDDANHGSLPP
jgi:cbb3-type cytochrome oxidase subunit 3